MGIIVGVLLGLFLVNLAVSAFLLWLSCRFVGARRVVASGGAPSLLVPVGYRRTLTASLLLSVANGFLVILLVLLAVRTVDSLLVWLLGLALFFCVSYFCLWLVLRLTAGKTVLVTLLSGVLVSGYAVGCVEALRLWVGEAYVTPTGAMAETLLGYHKQIQCPTCGQEFAVNASSEVNAGPDREALVVNGCTCPNCRQLLRLVDPKRDDREPRAGVLSEAGPQESKVSFREIRDPGLVGGDRFLIVKGPLFKGPLAPQRFDLVAFQYPERPTFQYIKRLVGLPGETIALHRGKLYRLPPEESPTYDDSAPKEELWQLRHTHRNDARARALFAAGKFEILRKSPETLRAMMPLVYDNDRQADDLKDRQWQRWRPQDDWKTDDNKSFRLDSGGKELSWLRYRHVLRHYGGKPSLITDFLGYNSGEALVWDPLREAWKPSNKPADANGGNWVADLLLECEVQIEKAEGQLIVELVRGGEKFAAVWDLASDNGLCTLTRTKGKETEKLESKPTQLRKGTHRLRFANVDDRLTVWVDDTLPFGAGVACDSPVRTGPTAADLQPVSIGVRGGLLRVGKIKLFRDVYYSRRPSEGDGRVEDWTDPEKWGEFKEQRPLTMFVQPGHYLCLGDNSLASADSRSWGLVPERHLLGKAVLVYYPLARMRRLP